MNRPPRDADVSFQTASLPAIPSQTGLQARRAAACAAVDAGRPRRDRRRRARVRGHVKVVQPKVTTADLAEKYPVVVTVDRAGLQAALLQEPEAREDLQDRGRARSGLETPAGLYHVQNKAMNPAWHVPEQRLGRRPRRQGDPRRRAREPAQGALARHLRRRRHPRHRRDRLARHARPRTAASGWRSRTSRSCTTRCRSRRLSTSSSVSR